MQLKNIFTDEDAVSPVIGVILMVAITVILAAVIGAFVLGIGSSQSSPPKATLAFNYNSTGDGVTVMHDGGDTITTERLSINFDSNDCSVVSPSSVSAGQPLVKSSSGDCDHGINSGGTLSITWTAPSGDSSQILQESTAP